MVERPFRFSPTSPNVSESATEIGSIELIICRVRTIAQSKEEKEKEKPEKRTLKVIDPVHEKIAKKGASLRVLAGEEVRKSRTSPTRIRVSRRKKGYVKIHVRRRHWLEAKKIINSEGNPWRPEDEQITNLVTAIIVALVVIARSISEKPKGDGLQKL